MTTKPDRRRLQRRRATPVALALLLALLWLGAFAAVATHHHASAAGNTCQACHAAHGAALAAPCGLPAPQSANWTPPFLPPPPATVFTVDLRVRGPPSVDGPA